MPDDDRPVVKAVVFDNQHGETWLEGPDGVPLAPPSTSGTPAEISIDGVRLDAASIRLRVLPEDTGAC